MQKELSIEEQLAIYTTNVDPNRSHLASLEAYLAYEDAMFNVEPTSFEVLEGDKIVVKTENHYKEVNSTYQKIKKQLQQQIENLSTGYFGGNN